MHDLSRLSFINVTMPAGQFAYGASTVDDFWRRPFVAGLRSLAATSLPKETLAWARKSRNARVIDRIEWCHQIRGTTPALCTRRSLRRRSQLTRPTRHIPRDLIGLRVLGFDAVFLLRPLIPTCSSHFACYRRSQSPWRDRRPLNSTRLAPPLLPRVGKLLRQLRKGGIIRHVDECFSARGGEVERRPVADPLTQIAGLEQCLHV